MTIIGPPQSRHFQVRRVLGPLFHAEVSVTQGWTPQIADIATARYRVDDSRGDRKT
jgi:hypothetical protein